MKVWKLVLVTAVLIGLVLGINTAVVSQVITDLDGFSLIGPTPGTYSGSDTFTVEVDNPAGATVGGSIGAFIPALTNTATVTVVPTEVVQGTTTGCTVTVEIYIALSDAPGTYQATLTITVTNKS